MKDIYVYVRIHYVLTGKQFLLAADMQHSDVRALSSMSDRTIIANGFEAIS